VRIDIGFGDVVKPRTLEADYPVLLDLPAPHIRVYPAEAVVAEKLQAMVSLGIRNSRMKDFYDLLVMSRELDFDGARLAKSIAATFERRRTPIPENEPLALTEEFGRDAIKVTQWGAFLQRLRLEPPVREFGEVVAAIASFLSPLLEAIRERKAFPMRWGRGGPANDRVNSSVFLPAHGQVLIVADQRRPAARLVLSRRLALRYAHTSQGP